MGFKMKGSSFYGKAGAFKQTTDTGVTDPKNKKSESKRKAEEILSYSASGDVDANREQALERQARIKNMSNEEWDSMQTNIAESAERSAEKRATRDAEKQAVKDEIARRNAMSKKERRKEDRKNK